MTFARSILVIHNMAHQGRGPLVEVAQLEVPPQYVSHFQLYDPIGGEHMNIFKAGLIAAHRLVAVSHGCVPRLFVTAPSLPLFSNNHSAALVVFRAICTNGVP